jgi:hypothetical protein
MTKPRGYTRLLACHTAKRVRFCQECGEQFVSPGNKKRCVQCEHVVKRARDNAARRETKEAST